MRQWIFAVLFPVLAAAPAPAGVLVVASIDESRVAIVDDRTFETLATVETGKSPHEVRISPDGRRAYVAAGKTITAVDVVNRRRHALFELEVGVHDVRVSRDGRTLWAAAGGAQSVLELDAETGRVLDTFDVGRPGPWFVEVSKDERTLFTPNLEGKSVSIVDRATKAVKVIPFDHPGYGVDLTPDGRQVWVSGGDLAVIDTRTKEVVARVKASEAETGRLRITPDGKKVVLALEKSLAVFDARTRRRLGQVPLPVTPKVLTLSGDGRRAFLTNPEDHSMSVVDLRPLRFVKTVPTGRKPDGIAWVDVPAARAEEASLSRARALLDRVGLFDGHNDLPWTLRENLGSDLSKVDLRRRGATVDTDIPRLREGRVAAQFWSVYIPSGLSNPARTQLEQIELARRMIDAYPDTFLFATSAADVERARKEKKIASFLGMENGQALENSLGALRTYHALGVRSMTLTHGRNNDWADSATDTAAHGGLTPFGREVVREMNRLGMLVDISHVSPDVMRQVLDLSEAPVIFSHSSARALVDHRRNVPDDVLARMARNGGVVMVTFIPAFVSAETAAWGRDLEAAMMSAKTTAEMERLAKEHAAVHGPAPKATLAQVADHVEHVARIAGRDHVGIGSDFYGSTDEPVGLEDVSRFPDLFAELVRRGWSDANLEKLAAGNALRVLRSAETVAARLRASREPSTATIEGLDRRP